MLPTTSPRVCYLSVECAEEVPFNDPAVTAAATAADPILRALRAARGPSRGVPGVGGAPARGGGEPGSRERHPHPPREWRLRPRDAASRTPRRRRRSSPRLACSSSPRWPMAPVWQNWVDECPASIAQQFLSDPAAEIDSSCIEAMPAPDFLTTSDIYPTSAVYRFNSDVVEDRNLVQIGIASVTIAILIGTLVYALVYGVAWLIRRRGGAPAGAVLAAATASGLNLAFAAALAYVVLNTDPLILAFGVPPAAPSAGHRCRSSPSPSRFCCRSSWCAHGSVVTAGSSTAWCCRCRRSRPSASSPG